ncbi:MAG TPA: ATP-binding protein [Nakamurella sp.]|nr:ATP-binding protein [Nakamurella sp.]
MNGGPARLTMSADALAVRELGPWLSEALAPTGAEAPALRGKMELAVHEICMNIVDHAYGGRPLDDRTDLHVECWVHPDAVLVRVSDGGSPFQAPAHRPTPGVAQIRGYGLPIVEKLADEVRYERGNGINIWSLRFRRAGPDRSNGHE